jgi:two-component system, NtrC family, response regulator HydG
MSVEQMNRAVRILVVDDQPGMRLTLKGILKKKGYEVAIAEDGLQAVEMARKTEYRVIFMDIKMPGISGVEAFVRIKQFSPKATVIMMTAFAMEDEIKRAIQEGAYAVLYKPLDIEKILRVVSESLEKQTLILLVDDRVEDRNLFRVILEKRGYSVTEVESGEECIKLIKEKRFQVILLDIKLPGIDGVETLKEIKSVRPDVAVIMVTAYSENELVEQAMQGGSLAFLKKPLDIQKLIETVNDCLKPGDK